MNPALLFPVAIILLAVATTVLRYRARQARARAVAALALRSGLTFSATDSERIVDMPFRIFRLGDRRAVELVVSGTHNGVPLHIFDYWYCVQSDKSSSYSRFTCALTEIRAACPTLQVSHENLFTRLGEDLGLHDVQLEYDDFNRRFRVKCKDQKFAFSLLDGGMMQWMLGSDSFESVDIEGPWVLLVAKQLDPAHWLDLGTWIDAFVRHVPSVVYSTYPPQ